MGPLPGSLSSGQGITTKTAPLVSADGRFAAVIQNDGNFVLCYATNGVADLRRTYWSIFANAAGQVAVIHDAAGQVEQLGGPPYQARMWPDGNFVLFVGADPQNIGCPYWGSGWKFQGHPIVTADFYLGGACWVVTDNQPNSEWNTQPPASPGQYTAVMQNDGNFVVYQGVPADNSPEGGPAWSVVMGSNIWASNTSWASQQVWVASGDRLTTNQWMANDTTLISAATGSYAAVFQPDGNLVLCHTTNGVPDLKRVYWSAPVNAAARLGPHFFAQMQSDGNFVLYNGASPASRGQAYWVTETTSRPQGQFTAVIQDDGNFVVYDASSKPIWASNTWWVSRPIIAIGPDRLGSNQIASWIGNDATLISADGKSAAVLRGDGNLALCHTTNSMPDLSRTYWSALSSGHVPPTGPPFYAVMQSDGNFVAYHGTGPGNQGLPYWATNTSRAQGQYTAVMQTDGNFVVYQGSNPIWASNTDWAAKQVTSGNQLTTGQWMTYGTALISAGASCAAVFQPDGSLVLCHTTNGVPDLKRVYWSAPINTAARLGPQYYAVMQSDGNFVLYNGPNPGSPGSPYWATNTSQARSQFRAIIQDDCDFEIWEGDLSIWASGTTWAAMQVTSGNQLTTGQWMANDTTLISAATGSYAAVFQPDGNLVLCHTTNGVPDLNKVYWSAPINTAARLGPHFFAQMQSDGNFVLYNGASPASRGQAYWATNAEPLALGQYTAVIQDDGNFVVEHGSNSIWASNTHNP